LQPTAADLQYQWISWRRRARFQRESEPDSGAVPTAADCSQLSDRAGHNHLGIRQLPLTVLEELLEIVLPPMNAPARRSPQPNSQLMRRLDIREMRCSAVSTAKNKSPRGRRRLHLPASWAGAPRCNPPFKI